MLERCSNSFLFYHYFHFVRKDFVLWYHPKVHINFNHFVVNYKKIIDPYYVLIFCFCINIATIFSGTVSSIRFRLHEAKILFQRNLFDSGWISWGRYNNIHCLKLIKTLFLWDSLDFGELWCYTITVQCKKC